MSSASEARRRALPDVVGDREQLLQRGAQLVVGDTLGLALGGDPVLQRGRLALGRAGDLLVAVAESLACGLRVVGRGVGELESSPGGDQEAGRQEAAGHLPGLTERLTLPVARSRAQQRPLGRRW
jgi:hypothetical protein